MTKKKESPKKKIGRPSIYNEKIVKKIISALQKGKSLRQIIREDNTLPNRDTIYAWLKEKKDFSDLYIQACKLRDEEQFERLVDLVEETPAEMTEINKARLIVDTTKWVLARRNPKKYSEKYQEQEATKDPVININLSTDDKSK